LDKSVLLNRPGKKQNSGYGLPLIAFTQNQVKKGQDDFNSVAAQRKEQFYSMSAFQDTHVIPGQFVKR